MKLCHVFKIEKSAVKVKIGIAIRLPEGSPLPSFETMFATLRVLRRSFAEGIDDQELWDWQNRTCKPVIQLSVAIDNDPLSSVEASVGIEYPNAVQRGRLATSGITPPRVLATRVRMYTPGDVGDAGEGDEVELRFERYVFRK